MYMYERISMSCAGKETLGLVSEKLKTYEKHGF